MKGDLQLAVGVKEAGSHGSLGNSEDLGDFCMGYSLNIKHGHNDSMVVRQLLHRGVQFFLQFMDGDLPRGVAVAGRCDEIRVAFDPAVGIVQARVLPAVPFLEEVDGHVHRDGVQPCVEA